jgi:hypothetical protein
MFFALTTLLDLAYQLTKWDMLRIQESHDSIIASLYPDATSEWRLKQ